MSLFRARELWATQAGGDVTESFDSASLLLVDLRGKQTNDSIVLGSHSGVLRIYDPQSGDLEGNGGDFKATDLLLETQLAEPILQLAYGKLVSGSQSQHLGVLHPLSLAVYNISIVAGSAEHGDQLQLTLVYEHQLRKSAYSLLVGAFGGVRGRDFTCIQSLDGTLTFYEQETLAFERSLPAGTFLLPGPIVYVTQSDTFVTCNANLVVEAYRYGSLGDDTSRKLVASWSHNLGEDVVDMQALTWQGAEAAILVLGERHVFCLREGGAIRFVKRLPFSPLCFHAYIVEPDGKLMIMCVSDTKTLLVYEQTTLCWSAQLSVTPVLIKRINFQSLRGLILTLTEEGSLQCSYLGTEPSLFVAPPTNKNLKSFEEAEQKYNQLQNEITTFSQNNLFRLEKGYKSKGHQLAIPLSDLQRYFDLPLTTCVVKENSMVLSLKVPLVSIGGQFQLHKYVRTPMYFDGQICQLQQQDFVLARRQEDGEIQVISGDHLSSCRAQDDFLCYLPRLVHGGHMSSRCMHHLFAATELKDIQQYCSLSCRPAKQELEIVEFSPSEYIVANIQANTTVTCEGVADSARLDTRGVTEHARGARSLDVTLQRCTVVATLHPSASLNNVQLTFTVQPPLVVSPKTHFVSNLCDKCELMSTVSMDTISHQSPAFSLELQAVAAYLNNSLTPHIVLSSLQLPLPLVLQLTTPSSEANHKITLTTPHPIPPFSQLFREFGDLEEVNCSDTIIGFQHAGLYDSVVTVIVSKSATKYRVQADTLAAATLLVAQLKARLESQLGNGKVGTPVLGYNTLALPTQELATSIEQHVTLRNSINELQAELGAQTAQFRVIQRRLLVKIRDKTPSSLAGLDTLLKDSYNKILEVSHQLQHVVQESEEKGCELSSVLRLVLLLISISEGAVNQDLADLTAALSYTLHASETQGWEEVSEAGVCYLLRTSLARSIRDQQRTCVNPLKEFGRFKKHIVCALERVMNSSSRPSDDARGVSPIMEGDEPPGSRAGRRLSLDGADSESHKPRLLPLRKQNTVALENTQITDEAGSVDFDVESS
ncbi:protein PTHB1 [Nilaparvata lugens]|uniref:protein PTHB1 n=1 Tax=Nilaparvata lugens TaxID=108931 RepID=UPI00193EC09D|nr:protein PTHB1 [Nilaparvata lugens]